MVYRMLADDYSFTSLATRLQALRTVPHSWGSTPAERQASFPADDYLPDRDDQLFRALDIAAPAPLTFRWLCQLRAAPYSYDWLDNLGRQSPRCLTPGLDNLAVGQQIMFIFRLVDFARDEHLTFTLRGKSVALFGEAAITYAVVAITPARSRVVVKLAIRYPFWGRRPIGRWLFAVGDLIMMRKQLRTLGKLAETMARRADI